jgi:glycosyltransferase involved in cell wall biosynthesis
MNISIIICTHNRAPLLKEALESITLMNVPSGCNVELIVVNNACSDETPAVIDEFTKKCRHFPVKNLEEPRLGKTYALNRAIRTTSSQIMSFVDDDHIVSEDYMVELIRAAEEHHDFNMFCGRVFPNWDGSEPQWVHDDSKYPIRPYPIPKFDLGEEPLEILKDKTFLPGSGNLMVRREVFERVGLFSEELGPKGHNLKGGEDIEFVRRALQRGERVLYIPEMKQCHQVFSENLRMRYLVKKAYLRSIVAYQHSGGSLLGNGNHGIPAYLIRQAITRLLRAASSFNPNARRYYLVRFAATLGEINGRRKALKSLSQHRTG